jgi:hypothetical protein
VQEAVCAVIIHDEQYKIRSLSVPTYQLFYEVEEPPKLANLLKGKTVDVVLWSGSNKDADMLRQFRRLFVRMKPDDFG